MISHRKPQKVDLNLSPNNGWLKDMQWSLNVYDDELNKIGQGQEQSDIPYTFLLYNLIASSWSRIIHNWTKSMAGMIG